MDWNDLKVVLALARTGTLAAAARALGVDATTVGRRLAAIEAALSARLFDRLTSGYVATEAGHRAIRRAEEIEQATLSLQNETEGSDQRIEGRVRLTGLDAIFDHLIIPRLPGLLDRYPGLEITFSSNFDFVDLSRREADIALRNREPRHPDSVGRRLGPVAQAAYAANALPAEAKLSLIGPPSEFEASDFARILTESFPTGTIVARAGAESHVLSLVRAGVGVGLLDCFVGDRDPGLRRVFPDPVWTQTVWAETHVAMARAPRIRVILGFLQDLFKTEEALLSGMGPGQPA